MLKTIIDGCEPQKATKFSACIDLFSAKDVIIGAGETKTVPLGIKIDLEKLKKTRVSTNHIKNTLGKTLGLSEEDLWGKFIASHVLKLHIRSSLAAKHGLMLANGTGIIDLDFPGEIGAIIHKPFQNTTFTHGGFGLKTDDKYQIKSGDKIAQIELCEHKTYLMGYDSEEERTGGFGSTGK